MRGRARGVTAAILDNVRFLPVDTDNQLGGQRTEFMRRSKPFAVPMIGGVRRQIDGRLRRRRKPFQCFGNTAEVVLDAVQSDVLVLKPQTLMDHLEELETKP